MTKWTRQTLFVTGALCLCSPLPALSAVAVRTTPVTLTTETPERRLPGRIEAVHHVAIQPRIEGAITRTHFKDGQQIQQGALLYELDDNEHRTSLAVAQGELKSAEATRRQAEQLLSRYQQLRKQHSISQNDLDNAVMQRDVARAAVDQAKARVDARKVTLAYTKIHAPISGRIGHSAFHQGNIVTPASGTLVDIVQLDPVRIAFSIDEASFFQKAGLHGDINSIKQAYVPEIMVGGERLTGSLVSIDNRVDPRTGSVLLRAEFANARQQLLPGGSIDVLLKAGPGPAQIAVPVAAVSQDAEGHFVWVARGDQADQQRVQTGEQLGQQVLILAGLATEDEIVIEGTQRLQPATTISRVN